MICVGTPRVAMKRMVASLRPLRRTVSIIASRQPSRLSAQVSRVARKESKKRSMCCSSLKIVPCQAETTSNTASPSRKPWSSTEMLAWLSGL
jgi:hypothetical protein